MARPKRAALKPRIAEFRHGAALTQEQVAERIGISAEMVRRHERGTAMPIRLYRGRYASLFGVSERDLWPLVPSPGEVGGTAPTAVREAHEQISALTLPVHYEYADDNYLSSVHGHIQSIVNLDNRFGGTDLYRLSGRLFRTLQGQLGTGSFDPHLERDLYAATGELAEVVGWLAYDAEEHELVRRMNQESLYYTRLAGDRTVELLTLQNASMHAASTGRPAEALSIARSVLEGSRTLSPRLRALFLTRKARALALGGDATALRLFAEVRSLFQEGTVDSDPAWAWWIDERELSWQEAMTLRDLGESAAALERFEHSVAAGPSTGIRSQYIHESYLLRAQVEAGDWAAVEGTIGLVGSHISDVASTRAVVLLGSVAAQIDRGASLVPRAVRHEGERLKSALALAPVG